MSLKLRCQRGFTTVTLMGVLMVGGLMVAAGFAAVDPDIGLSRQDQDYKQAYAAAEAGLNYYLYHLGQDNNYFIQCDDVPSPGGGDVQPVNQVWTSGPDLRRWRQLPGEAPGTKENARYSIELLPARGYSQCENDNQASMLDPATGTFRIRVTGCIPPPGKQCSDQNAGVEKRSIIATLRRKGFIDFLYFTEYETSDPATYPRTDSTVGEGSTWAAAACDNKIRQQRHPSCVDIRFVDDDVVDGPLHTNDDVLTCDSPTFGRTKNDAIELNGPSPGFIRDCGARDPNFKGTRVWPGGTLVMPPTNGELANIAAEDGYTFLGRTIITLNGSSMTVQTFNPSRTQTLSMPPNGVIWVGNGTGGCPAGYSRRQTYTSTPSSCGNVEVRGNYSDELTIATQNDIIVTENLERNADGLLLGLVAQNFVRVYHPVTNWRNSNTDCTNSGGPGSITIEAAILAMKHSFIVDNWYCGDNDLGTLTVDGAIAQRFRGPVGTGNSSSIVSGYLKNYVYNDRLRFREPPFFIDPVQSSWRVSRQNEQVPAR